MTEQQMSPRAEEIFFEIHRDNPREGPGSFEATRKAYSALTGLPDKPIILDIGCGPGQQTLDLASLSAGTIHAIDNYEPYLKALQTKVDQKGLADRVFPRTGDMNALPFEQAYFDAGYDFVISSDHRGPSPQFTAAHHGMTPDPLNAPSGKDLLWIRLSRSYLLG